jgi:multimeric flavodoxin WrbA/nitrite reductase/ring-hydroxylating ferredoxin subunit
MRPIFLAGEGADMNDDAWYDVGDAAELSKKPLQQVLSGRQKIALSCVDGTFGAIHGACNHAGGPLGEGTLDGDYVVCPWHNWKFHRLSGEGEPGYEEDRVPRFELKVEAGRLLIRDTPASSRNRLAHAPHPLDRDTRREPGPLRVAGISTTVMDNKYPRYSTSEALLESALEHGRKQHGLEVRMIKLRELSFRACEGYYSKSARACTWPCSISQMDSADGMNAVYENLVFWADVILVATPIRWGAASSLYFKMAERLNTVQNQITTKNRVMLINKVAGFIVTGGQDNVQAVAGQMMLFFGELGMHFPQYPFIAHSRGWTAEDMERNVEMVRRSKDLHDGARALLDRCLDLADRLQRSAEPEFERAGRKASGLERHNRD